MIPLLSETGLRRLDDIITSRLLCVFDFDGTLTPIVARPEQAFLPQNVLERLNNLSVHVPVAILTGRSVADIRSRLGFDPDYVIGNHGFEGMPGWEAEDEHHQQLCQSWKTTLAHALKDGYAEQGVWIEDKRYSLTVHYRSAQTEQAIKDQLKTLFAQALPEARVIEGKSIFNLVPEGAPHKGDALQKLIEISGARSAIYVGDDITDEDAFRVRRQNIMTVRVEYHNESSAEFYLKQWQDIVVLLDELIRRLDEMQVNGMRIV
jgi:trehalose 6-phosphate phosphatase